jgi:Ca2+-binding RTX toxin-like protein
VVVDAGDLDDTVSVGDFSLPLRVDGGAGNDQVTTGSDDDRVDGGAGNDTIDTGAGADTLIGGDGDDQLIAGIGDDAIEAGAGVDTVDGDLGNDRIDGGVDGDQIDAGPGDDAVSGGSGDDQVSGGDGNDALAGDDGVDRMGGDDGEDRLDGGAGVDDLDGGGGRDAVVGGDGDDLLQSTDGGDALEGGAGNDQLEGDDLDNALSGGSGADRLNSYGGADRLLGDDGDDVLSAGAGADVASGGGGRDTVSYDESFSGVAVSLNGAADDGAVGEGDNVLGDVEVVVGSAANDTLVAGAFAVQLQGGVGDDTLVGSPQGDLLSGGAGADTMDGAGGPDALSGGDDLDAVTYAARAGAVAVSVGTPGGDGQAGEGDDVAADVERVIGTALADRLSGADGLAVELEGGGGNDQIALPRETAVESQLGLGTSRAMCGTGTDTVTGGLDDQIDGDCDIVTVDGRLVRLGVQGEPTPRLTVAVTKVRPDARGRLLVPVSCGSESLVRCTTTVTITRAGRRLGSVKALVGRGRSQNLRVTLRGRQVSRLYRHGGAVTVRLSVLDKGRRRVTGNGVVAVKRQPRKIVASAAASARRARSPARGERSGKRKAQAGRANTSGGGR